MSRYKARERAFLTLFESSFKPDESINELIAGFYEESGSAELGDESQYFEEILKKCDEEKGTLDEKIREHLKEWKLERISRVARIALTIAICELDNFEDIPPLAAINEAVELTIKYAGLENGSFVNGVLAEYYRERQHHRKADEAAE